MFFRYEDGVGSGQWQMTASANGTDSTTTAVTVVASTRYHLKIVIDSDRIAKFYINGILRKTSSALKTGVDFIPYICVEADGAAEAKTLDIYGQAISRAFGG